MKKRVGFLYILVFFFLAIHASSARERILLPEQQTLFDSFVWYPSPNPNGSSAVSFYLGGKLVYVDPVIIPELLPGLAKADLILITHTHKDHYSLSTIQALLGPSTRIIGVKEMGKDVKGAVLMLPGDFQELAGLKVQSYPAYNIAHGRIQDWLAFTVSDGVQTVFISGDTDMQPEFTKITGIDVAVYFMDPPLTLSIEDAIKMTKTIKPAAIIPVHWRLGFEEPLALLGKKVGSKSFFRVLEKYQH